MIGSAGHRLQLGAQTPVQTPFTHVLPWLVQATAPPYCPVDWQLSAMLPATQRVAPGPQTPAHAPMGYALMHVWFVHGVVALQAPHVPQVCIEALPAHCV